MKASEKIKEYIGQFNNHTVIGYKGLVLKLSDVQRLYERLEKIQELLGRDFMWE